MSTCPENELEDIAARLREMVQTDLADTLQEDTPRVSLSSAEIDLLNTYRSLTVAQRRRLIAIAKILGE